jgi:multiple sugar transport system permease protein
MKATALENGKWWKGLLAIVCGLGLVLLGLQLAPGLFEGTGEALDTPKPLTVLAALTLPMAGIALVLGGLYAFVSGSALEAPVRTLVSYALLVALGLFLVAPFVWMVLISLHPSKTPIPPLGEILPRGADGTFSPNWQNYSFVLNHPTLPVSRFFLNTVVVTVSVVIGQLFIASLAAYGFARLRFKGRDAIFYLFLGSMMFAGPVTQIPVYLILRSLGWLDTYWALIVPGVGSAFSVFLLRQFFLQIPNELDEAARMDGAGDFKIYWHVMLPLSRAALATAGAFTFFAVWTDFFNPLIFTNSTEMRTLEVGLSIFKNSYGGSNWPLQMTAAVIVMFPLLLVFLFLQRYFVRGIMMGSIK